MTRQLDVRPEPPARRHELIFQTWGSLDVGEAFELVNDHDPKPLYYQFAAEHVNLQVRNEDEVLGKLQHAGAVFIGPAFPGGGSPLARRTLHEFDQQLDTGTNHDAPAHRAIAFARVRRRLAKDQANAPAMAASVMLAHPGVFSGADATVRMAPASPLRRAALPGH